VSSKHDQQGYRENSRALCTFLIVIADGQSKSGSMTDSRATSLLGLPAALRLRGQSNRAWKDECIDSVSLSGHPNAQSGVTIPENGRLSALLGFWTSSSSEELGEPPPPFYCLAICLLISPVYLARFVSTAGSLCKPISNSILILC